MNTTLLTRELISQDYFDCESLHDLIAQIESEFQKKGQVVCQVIVNDIPLHENDEARMGSARLDEINTLEIKTTEPGSLLREIIHNWLHEFPKMIEMCDQNAEQFRLKGKECEYTAFVRLIDSCQFLTDSLVSVDTIIHVDRFIDKSIWFNNEELMTQAVGGALGAFEKQDFIQLADVLEYDLANTLQAWFDLVQELDKKLEQMYLESNDEFYDSLFKKQSSEANHSVGE